MEVLGLHDVELGDEGINRLILFVHITRVFKFSSEMQKLLDLVFVFKNAVDPALQDKSKDGDVRVNEKKIIAKTYLELGFTHGAIETVLERLVLEVEFDIILIGAVTNCDIEVHLDGALWDGPQLVGLAELHVIPDQTKHRVSDREEYLLEHVAVFLTKEHLVDIDS